MNGASEIRGFNMGPQNNLHYKRGSTKVKMSVPSSPSLMCVSEQAPWGRYAHEIGHSLIRSSAVGLIHPEDVYDSDLSDPDEATARNFDLMGSHNPGPLYSAYFMDQLGWYRLFGTPATSGSIPPLIRTNTLNLPWKPNPPGPAFSREIEVVAHGSSPNTMANRYHIIRIMIASGINYYIEVRQRPPPSSGQIFDAQIPLNPSSSVDGGVVVTKAISGNKPLNNNQQTNLITLLQGRDRVYTLKKDDEVLDPARNIRIVVVNDSVSVNPLVCRVRVEWGQTVSNNPTGVVDANIRHWGPDFKSEDIWVDQFPYETPPVDVGDDPLVPSGVPGSVYNPNRIVARIRNNGSAPATNVAVSHYVTTPPGIGDNGNWQVIAPINSNIIPVIGPLSSETIWVPWTPRVNQHTCIQVQIGSQIGEIDVGNNMAQENIFKFISQAKSPGNPIEMDVSVRNPLRIRTMIRIHTEGVLYGFYFYFPHTFLWLNPLEERTLTMLVVPILPLEKMGRRNRSPVRISAFVPRVYKDESQPTWWSPIGGITVEVTCKKAGAVVLQEKVEWDPQEAIVIVRGSVMPEFPDQDIRVYAESNDGLLVSTTKTDEGGKFSVEFFGVYLGKGTHAFQANILTTATVLAPSESNIVHYTVR
jgi:hypothetical protein